MSIGVFALLTTYAFGFAGTIILVDSDDDPPGGGPAAILAIAIFWPVLLAIGLLGALLLWLEGDWL